MSQASPTVRVTPAQISPSASPVVNNFVIVQAPSPLVSPTPSPSVVMKPVVDPIVPDAAIVPVANSNPNSNTNVNANPNVNQGNSINSLLPNAVSPSIAPRPGNMR